MPADPVILFERRKRIHDRTVRCYLTLRCPLACEFCSAGLRGVSEAQRAAWQPPEVWAAGITARGRHAILGGGEPLLYEGIGALCAAVDPTVRVTLYTNAVPDPSPVLAAGRPFEWLVSFHTATPDIPRWLSHVLAIVNSGHKVRFHLVKDATWRARLGLLRQHFPMCRVTVCDDQRLGPRSVGAPRRVRCTLYCELWGPDGRRYPCITLMGQGECPQEAWPDRSGPDGYTIDCARFGSCVGCDNNIEGRSIAT